MATQWVNFPDDDKVIKGKQTIRRRFVDKEGIPSTERMGRTIYIMVTFRTAQAGQQATLIMKPDPGNADYTDTEKAHRPGIFAPGQPKATVVAKDGTAKFKVQLSVAGGDSFTFAARSGDQEVPAKDEIRTARLLYYQIVRMRSAPVPDREQFRDFERTFWGDLAQKLCIKLKRHGLDTVIRDWENVGADETAILSAARKAVHDRSKAPFCVVVLLANKVYWKGKLKDSIPVTFDGNAYALELGDWEHLRSAEPGAPLGNKMTFTPAGGRPISIPEDWLRPGKRKLLIDTSHLPRGKGELFYNVPVVGEEAGGYAYSDSNLVVVATQNLDGSRASTGAIIDRLIHEFGHKIGMVPGGKDGGLDKQATYDDKRSRSHCRDPGCIMYFTPNPKNHGAGFCSYCLKSVRKLDLSPERKSGLATQF